MNSKILVVTIALAGALALLGIVHIDHRIAFAEGVCTQAQDARLLQPGRYADCVAAVTRDPGDR